MPFSEPNPFRTARPDPVVSGKPKPSYAKPDPIVSGMPLPPTAPPTAPPKKTPISSLWKAAKGVAGLGFIDEIDETIKEVKAGIKEGETVMGERTGVDNDDAEMADAKDSKKRGHGNETEAPSAETKIFWVSPWRLPHAVEQLGPEYKAWLQKQPEGEHLKIVNQLLADSLARLTDQQQHKIKNLPHDDQIPAMRAMFDEQATLIEEAKMLETEMANQDESFDSDDMEKDGNI